MGEGSCPKVQLHGFRDRVWAAQLANIERDLYLTDWHAPSSPEIPHVPFSFLLLGAASNKVPYQLRRGALAQHRGPVQRLPAYRARTIFLSALGLESGHDQEQFVPLVSTVLALLQDQAKCVKPPPLYLITVNTQDIEGFSSRVHSRQSSMWGLARSTRAASIELSPFCVDLEQSSSKQRLPIKLLTTAAQITSEWAEPELAVRGGVAHVPRLERIMHAGELPEQTPLYEAGTQLVTGGTSGIGMLTARWVALQGARNLVLTSSTSEVGYQAASEMRLLQRCDTVFEIDHRTSESEVCDMRWLVTDINFDMLPLDGIYHAAGLLSEGLLPTQRARMLRRAFAPKAVAAVHLESVTHGLNLRLFVFFSAVGGLLGSMRHPVQSAANSMLDAQAARRHSLALAAVSVQWGQWAETEPGHNPAFYARLQANGFGLISAAQGLAVLSRALLTDGETVVAAIPAVWHRVFQSAAYPDAPAFLSNFAPQQVSRGPDDKASTPSCAAPRMDLKAVLDIAQQIAGSPADADTPLMEAGLDSLGAVELRNSLQRITSMSLPGTLLFNHPTVRQITTLLAPPESSGVARRFTPLSMPVRTRDPESPHATTVFVSALGVQLPSGVGSAEDAWRMAACATDVITEVPATRWQVPRSLGPEFDGIVRQAGHGGFVHGAELLDNGVFSVSPAEASAMDPQQRMLLERGYEAFHGAGYDRASLLDASLVGVFIGIENHDFEQVLASTPLGQSVFAATGSSLAIAGGRLSYVFGLEGPCVAFATACSAALTATHANLRALQRKESSAGLTCGVSLMLTPGVSFGFAVAGMTSALGRCHTFDRRADGYARAEACCATALACDEAGIALLGSAVRQDGKSASLTAPNGQAQARLLRAALADAESPAEYVAVIEAHGTGTALGDPIEAGSLKEAVLAWQAAMGPLAVGSVKANSGHGEPAAGIAGLVTLVLKMESVAAPRNAQLHVMNPHVKDALRGAQFVMPCQLGRLRSQAQGEPMLGGVSSFGYSGTIAHAVLGAGAAADAPPTALKAKCRSRLTKRRLFSLPARAAATSAADAVSLYTMAWSPLAPHTVDRVTPKVAAVVMHLPTDGAGLISALRDGTADRLESAIVELSPGRSGHSLRMEVGSDPRPWQMAVVLLDGADGVAPSMRGVESILQLGEVLQLVAPGPLLLLTRGVHAPFPLVADSPKGAAFGPAWGLLRVLRIEEPALRAVSVDVVGSAEVSALAHAVEAVLHTLEQEQAWLGVARHAGRLCLRAPLAAAEARPRRNPARGGSFLVTGGLGGLGLKSAARLIRLGATSVVLTSRSGRVAHAGQGLEEQLHQLQASPRAHVGVAVGDAASACELSALLRDCAARRAAPLVGVLHAAGVVKDVLLRTMNAAHLKVVFAPKAGGAHALHGMLACASRVHELLFFSSTAAAVGSRGQGNYAAANCFLDALSTHRRVVGMPAHSLQLPMVTGAGMGQALIQASSSTAALGFSDVSIDIGTYELLLTAVLGGASGRQAPPPIQAAIPLALQQILFGGPSEQHGAADGRAGEAQQSSMVLELLRMPPSQRQERMVSLVLDCVHHVVEDVSGLDVDLDLAEVGVDSIAATELGRLLESSLGTPVPVNLATTFNTAGGIASHLLAEVLKAAPAGPPEAPADAETDLEATEGGAVQAAARLQISTPWQVVYEGAELLPGGQVLRIIPRGESPAGGDLDLKEDPLVFVHSIVGAVPIPSLRRLQYALGGRELLAMTHEGYTTGQDDAFPTDVTMEQFADRYAVALMAVCGDRPFHLMGLSFGATLAHCIAVAAKKRGSVGGKLVLIDPCPPPPHPEEYFASARSVGLKEAAFNCIFGVIDGSVPYEMMGKIAHDIQQMPEDALAAYVTSHYVRTGGIKGEPWDVMLTARQLRVYQHCALVTSKLTRATPFGGEGGSAAILMVTASKRSEFFAPMHLHDSSPDGESKMPLFGPVAVSHHMDGEHTICCAACVSGRDPYFVDKLRAFLAEPTAAADGLDGDGVDRPLSVPEEAASSSDGPSSSFRRDYISDLD